MTKDGISIALFFTRSYAWVLRSGTAQVIPPEWQGSTDLRRAFDGALQGIDAFIADARIAA